MTLLAAVVATVAIVGCNNTANTPATPTATPAATPAKTVTYVIVPKMLSNPVFALAQRGAQKAGRDLDAADPTTKHDIIFQTGEKGDAAGQAETINTFTAKKVDGMSVSAIDANAVRQPINDAVDAGIPVICFDSNATGSKAMTLFGISDEAAGRELANQIVAALGKANVSGEFAIMSGQSSAPNLQARVKAVQDVLNPKDYPGAKFLPILYCDDKIDRAVELIRTTMQAHPKLKGLILVGGWPLFAKGALDNVDPSVTKVVAVDALSQEQEYLESGKVYCLVGQRCFGWGERSVHILDELRTGKSTPESLGKFVDSGYDLIYANPTPEQLKANSDNVRVYSLADYRKQWTEWNKEM